MKLNQDEIFYINELVGISGVAAKSCIITPTKVMFLVQKERMGQAIGKKGINIKNLSKKINKKIEIYSFSDDLKEFIQSNIPEIKVLEVEKEDKKIKVKVEQLDRTKIIANKKKINLLKLFMDKTKGINEIKLLK